MKATITGSFDFNEMGEGCFLSADDHSDLTITAEWLKSDKNGFKTEEEARSYLTSKSRIISKDNNLQMIRPIRLWLPDPEPTEPSEESEKAAWNERKQRWKQHQEKSLRHWIFRNKEVTVEGWETATKEEVMVYVSHTVLKAERDLERMKREIEVLQRPIASREPIPEAVKFQVWRRDEGRCVKCGSQERLEFDHVIPLSKGGSDSERNIQVLCERCNREKGAII